MTSIEEASGAVGGNAEQARELAANITASKSTLDSLAAATAALGMESKANEANSASEKAEELAGQAGGLADSLDALRSQIEALRDLLASDVASGNGGGQSHPVVSPQSSVSSRVRGPARNGIKPPNAGRHKLGSIRKSTPTKAKNTIILPGVNIEGDLEAIRNGEATWLPGIDRYQINGRTWGVKENGTTFPDSGPGLVTLDREGHKALKELIKARKPVGEWPASYGRDPSIAESDWQKAAEVYRHHPHHDQGAR